jgi:hypothetical protein
LTLKTTNRWELERRKQLENKSRIVFRHLKRISSTQDGRREKLITVLKSPGNKESDFIIKNFL